MRTNPTRRGPLLLLAAAIAVAACESPTPPPAAITEAPTPESAADALDARTSRPGPEDRSSILIPGDVPGAALIQVAAIDAAGATTRLTNLMNQISPTGTKGFYVQEIGGPVIVASNENFVFEPASTIKALTHYHAMLQIQNGATVDGEVVTLARIVDWFGGPSNYALSPGEGQTSCPDLSTLPQQDPLSEVLRTMMVDSDNRTTGAARLFFGELAIENTRIGLGMASSRHVHLIGCGPQIAANPNWLTLADAGRLYEAFANNLDVATRAAAFGLMPRDFGLFDDITVQEAAGLGLSANSRTQFRNLRDAALKAGSYNVTIDGDPKRHRSVAGWSSIPFRNATCALEPRQYAWGAFVQASDSVNTPIRTVGAETLREPIRAALETWAECEADLAVTAVAVLNLADPLYVNQQANFTVRASVINTGPASSVDAILSVTADAPADCSYDATPKSTPVNGLANGVAQNVDINFSVTCTKPSDHQFSFTARIEPQLASLLDPVAGNNMRTANESRELIAYADLGIAAWDFSALDNAVLGDFVIGQDFSFSATQTLRNLGDSELNLYFDAAESLISRSLVVPEGIRASVTVAPAEASASVIIQRQGQPDEVMNMVPALTTVEVDGEAVITVTSTRFIGVQQTLDIAGQWTIRCTQPGDYTLDFTGTIAAVDPHLLDPEPADNSVDVSRSIDCAVPVQLNIRPGNQFNQVNPGSEQVVPSAVLTTMAGEYGLPMAFDATTIDPQSVRFGTVPILTAGGGGTVHQHFIRDSFEMDDRTRDGDLDMVLNFRITGAGISAGLTTLHVKGRFQGAGGTWYTFVGWDAIQVQGN